MSLATRCANCGTVFRVVADQLKVSEGWVRCGQCGEVFNAEKCLLGPLPEQDEPELPEPAGPVPAAWSEDDGQAARQAGIQEWAGDVSMSRPLGGSSDALIDVGLPAGPSASEAASPDAGFEKQDPFYFDTDALAASFKASALYDSDLSFEPGGERNKDAAQPGFLRRAERVERWNRPAVRGVLGVACAALGVLLFTQIAYLRRDDWAARWPAARPLFLSACSALGCRINSPLQIEDISLDSSQLSASSTARVLRLDVALHNRAHHAVLMPALELNFTADTGEVLARRVLPPAEFAKGVEALEAESHWTSTLWLDVGSLRVAGYTVAVFYP